MGLDTTHDCWHGAYSAFNRWRNHIATVAGYQIGRDELGDGLEGVMLEWDHFRKENYQGEWDDGPFIDDPLLHLIVHSDCDGVIHPKHARSLADRLKQLLPKLDEGQSGGHIWSMREVTQRFIDGLRKAADADEDVEFR